MVATITSAKNINILLPPVYRYIQKEFEDMFFETGVLRITSFQTFRNYPDEIRGDTEEGKGLYVAKSKEGTTNMVMHQASDTEYMFCTSLQNSTRIKEEFKVDSCFKINAPIEFANAILNVIPGSISSHIGCCNYQNERILKRATGLLTDQDFQDENGNTVLLTPSFNRAVENIISNPQDLNFLKKDKYQYQSEFRFVWTVDSRYFDIHPFLDVTCKEAIQYCERF